MNLAYSSNTRSELNTARWHYHLARTMRRYANRGFGCRSTATRHWNIARARLARALHGPAEHYPDALAIVIRGIPASYHVTYYRPPVCERVWGVHPDFAEPAEPAEVEGIICDRGGYPAAWLEEMADIEDVERQVLDSIRYK